MNWVRGTLNDALHAALQPGANTAADIAKAIGCTRMAAYQALKRMGDRRQIGVRIIGGGNVYFRTPAEADEFGASAAAVLADQLRRKRAENLEHNKRRPSAMAERNQVVKQKPGKPAPVVIIPAPQVERPVDMSRAVLTTAKTPPGRFEADPAAIVPGAFLVDMPPGRWSDYAVVRAGS